MAVSGNVILEPKIWNVILEPKIWNVILEPKIWNVILEPKIWNVILELKNSIAIPPFLSMEVLEEGETVVCGRAP